MDAYLHPEGLTAQGLVNLSEFLAAHAAPVFDFVQARDACLIAVDERMLHGLPPRWALPSAWARRPESAAAVFALAEDDMILVPDDTPAQGISERDMLEHMVAGGGHAE